MSNEIQFILYQLPDDEGKVQVVIKDETIWATQKAMAQLYDIDKSGISRHIANILKEVQGAAFPLCRVWYCLSLRAEW